LPRKRRPREKEGFSLLVASSQVSARAVICCLSASWVSRRLRSKRRELLDLGTRRVVFTPPFSCLPSAPLPRKTKKDKNLADRRSVSQRSRSRRRRVAAKVDHFARVARPHTRGAASRRSPHPLEARAATAVAMVLADRSAGQRSPTSWLPSVPPAPSPPFTR
jgi:hypothetical protein